MNAAFAIWKQRIAPVFDVCRQICLIEVTAGAIVAQRIENIPEGGAVAKVSYLAEHQVRVVVCGAISRVMEAAIVGAGIQVIPFVAGDWQEIANAWLAGTIGEDRFAMPGCCQRQRHCRRQRKGCRHDHRIATNIRKEKRLCQEEIELDHEEPEQ